MFRIVSRLGAMVLLLGFAVTSARACSQCLCGDVFPADAFGRAEQSRFRYGFEDRFLSKSNGLDDGPGTEAEREHRIAAFGVMRLTPHVQLLARLPWAFKEITSSPEGGPTSIARSNGLGDAEVSALWRVVRPSVRGANGALSLVGGFVAPTGSNDKRDAAGERLDAHLQPGTGAWSGTFGADLSLVVAASRYDFNTSWRTNTGNAHGYRYGDVWLCNAGVSHRAGAFELQLQLNGRSAKRDRSEDGTPGGNTGGTVLYAAPGVRWFTPGGVAIEAAVQIPAAQALNGAQSEHTTARVSFSLAR